MSLVWHGNSEFHAYHHLKGSRDGLSKAYPRSISRIPFRKAQAALIDGDQECLDEV
ncbi:hypothetical protein OH76DRAFT_1411982 [Lentinus brumalis]|uniref:Uncharacterized protein n=1 Tax=Lentinus brumalis TaxID=2498619 RepID=A0A371CMS9_9APHY|nr:hypothetical protein OH76DRAFT_1411982 [Polyporus brumalis]